MLHLQTFGKYQIVRKLSRSMTDVYLATDTETNRPIVLKLIEHSRDEYTQVVIEAEKRGALLQTQLHQLDPRILEVYEYGEQNGCFFVAMEYFEGRTLAQILQAERRLDPARAARYAAEICSQLKTLHSFVSDVNGRQTAVVHGDVKPANVQIGAQDRLRLLDFGIAKVITSTHNLTHHNLGSPSYCSPERISRSQVDQHSDLWAAGVTLYEMLAGSPPYQAQTTRKLENLIQSRRQPRALPPDCPTPLKTIVAKALAGDLERRYQSAAAFGSDLAAFLDGKRTLADRERDERGRAENGHGAAWNANATIEKRPTEPRPTEARPAPAPSKVATTSLLRAWTNFPTVIALLAGILVGLLVFIPLAYHYRLTSSAASLRAPKDYAHHDLKSLNSDWRLYNELKTGNYLGLWSPGESLDAAMHEHLVNAADDILESFRHSTDQQLSDFDWTKARLCLEDAREIQPADSKTKGELALIIGYLDLAQKPPQTARAIDSFHKAEWYSPRLPDPHLGLARIYVYEFHNVGRAVAELHQANQLGYKLGPREIEQQADGYLFRAEFELGRAKRTPSSARQDRSKWLQLAHDDMERARNLYEPIAGYSNVSTNLEQLHQDRDEQAKLQMENVQLVTARPRPVKHYASTHRWQ